MAIDSKRWGGRNKDEAAAIDRGRVVMVMACNKRCGIGGGNVIHEEVSFNDDAAPSLTGGRCANKPVGRGEEIQEDDLEELVGDVVQRRRPGRRLSGRQRRVIYSVGHGMGAGRSRASAPCLYIWA